jgi:hypothetical protein
MQADIDSGFVSEHSLHGIAQIENGFVMEGQIACLGGIIIDVRKVFEIVERTADGDYVIQTREYKYNASVRGVEDSTFLRYDNAHEHPGHRDKYHRHDLDWKTGKKLPGSPSWIGLENWLMLSHFVDMVRSWRQANQSDLPNPDGDPQLGKRQGTVTRDDDLD